MVKCFLFCSGTLEWVCNGVLITCDDRWAAYIFKIYSGLLDQLWIYICANVPDLMIKIYFKCSILIINSILCLFETL